MRVVERGGKVFNFASGTSDVEIADAMDEYFEADRLPIINSAKELSEISGPAFRASMGVLTTGDQDEMAKIIKANIPESSVRRAMDGSLIADLPSGSYVLNRPGIDTGDLLRFGTQAVAFLPAGKAATMASTFSGRAAVSGAASAATQAALEGGQEAIGGDFDTGEVVLAGALGAASELALPAASEIVNRLRSGRQAREAARQSLDAATLPETIEQATRAQETTRQTGVQLLRGQQTLDPFALEEQSFLTQLPESSRKAFKVLRKQDEQAAIAVREFLSSVAPSTSVRSARRSGREAAKEAISVAKQARSDIAGPLYREAFDEFTGRVDVAPVIDEINVRKLAYPQGHAARRALEDFADDISINADDLQRLQGVKEIVDGKLQSIEGVKPSAQTNKARRELSNIESILLDQMDIASPKFAQARREFAKRSPRVQRLEEGPIGLVAGLKDTQLKTLTQKILDPEEATTRTVIESKKAILGVEGGKDKWDAIVRAEIERRLSNAKNSLDDVLGGNQRSIQNVPANMLNAIFPKSKSRDVLRAALDKDGRKRLDFLEDALRRAGSGRGIGSQTGIRSEIKARFGGGVTSAIRRFISSPVDSVAQIGEESARAARIRAVADSAFNPDWSQEMAQVMRLQRLGEHTRAEQAYLRVLQSLEKSQVARAMLQASRDD